ncbi:unnamed protein product [Malus baccata var. baccata]
MTLRFDFSPRWQHSLFQSHNVRPALSLTFFHLLTLQKVGDTYLISRSPLVEIFQLGWKSFNLLRTLLSAEGLYKGPAIRR